MRDLIIVSIVGAGAVLHNLGSVNITAGTWNSNTLTFTTAGDVSGGVSLLHCPIMLIRGCHGKKGTLAIIEIMEWFFFWIHLLKPETCTFSEIPDHLPGHLHTAHFVARQLHHTAVV